MPPFRHWRRVPSRPWTKRARSARARSAISWSRAEHGSVRSEQACRNTGGSGACRDSGARTWRSLPTSAWSTTRDLSAATRAAPPTTCSTRSVPRCSSTGPSGSTSSISSVPTPSARRAGQLLGREVRPSITRIVDALCTVPAFVMNGHLDVLYANALAEALHLDLFGGPERSPTCSWTLGRRRSTRIGTRSRMTSSRCCAERPDVRHRIARSRTSSGYSRLAARTSGCSGRAMTSVSTARARSAFAIRSWANSR